jgi:tetratricopeptide (TPR) repeat protein
MEVDLSPVTPRMSESPDENPVANAIDTAAEISSAMMTSMAEVVQSVIPTSAPEPVVEIQGEQDFVMDVEALVTEGENAHRNGDHSRALEAFNKAIAMDPSNAMAWFNRGVLLEAEQDSKGAKQSFVICLDLDSNHGPALANLAVLLDRIEDNDGALEIATRALDHFPGHPSLTTIIDKAKAAGAQISTVPKVMPHSQEMNSGQQIHTAVGSSVEELFEEKIVEEVIEDTFSIVAIDLDQLCSEATSLLGAGDPKGALNLLKEHLHGDAANHFDAWRIAASAMATIGLDDHAIGAFTHAVGIDPNHAKTMFNLGAIHERKENYQAAKKCFEQALEIDPNYIKAAAQLISLADQNGDLGALLDAHRIMVNLDSSTRLNLATLLVELAEGESAILENSAGLPPTIPEGPALASEAAGLCDQNTPLMGRALSASGQHTQAVMCWKTLIQNDKDNSSSWTGLARALEAAGDLATAQRCHEKAELMRNPAPPAADPFESLLAPTPVPEPAPLPHVEAIPQFPLPQAIPEAVQVVPTAVQQAVVQMPLPEMTVRPEPVQVVQEERPDINLAAATLEASNNMMGTPVPRNANSRSIANQDIEWYNKGVGLIEDKKYREALSCFDRALPSFAGDDEMVIRIINGRGNALYYLADYPKCVEAYHQAMIINPSGVQGKTLYNMGTAYAEMQRFTDALKCFEQSMPRGLDDSQVKLAKEQIRRCNILLKEQQRNLS